EIVTTPQVKTKRNIGLYGEPKSGKTVLATSLPWGDPWGERAIYVAWDAGSETLDVVPASQRNRFIVVRPTPTTLPNKQMVFDAHTEAITIASRDWKKEFPDVGTIIWDTMTATARDLLAGYADTGAFS